MASPSQISTNRGWAAFGLRWVWLVVLVVTVYIVQERTLNPFEEVTDLAVVLGIGAGLNVLLGILNGIPALGRFLPYVSMIADWVIAGAFGYLSGGDPLILLAVAAPGIILGFSYGDLNLAPIQSIGILVSSGVGMGLSGVLQAEGFELAQMVPVVAIAILLVIAASAWGYFIEGETRQRNRQIRTTLKDQSSQITEMRERARIISEMATTLNATLNLDDILDAALDIGRMSLKKTNKQRLVSLVLLNSSEDRLDIANSRGLQHLDESKSFKGESGIIAEAFSEAVPVISEDGENDPELSKLIAFRNIRSVLCIPLRAGFSNFGVLIYGSDQRDAFNTEQVDMLKSIGTQATVALQNAVLYRNLMQEKERIIEKEKNARAELVRDLHDVPTQTVSAVAMRLGLIPKMLEKKPDLVLKEVQEIREMTLRATEEIRNVMFRLRPMAVESEGLTVALKQLCDKMRETYGQNMESYVDPRVQEYYDATQQGNIFYMIEEAANNARKHAKASLIKATVTVEGRYVMVRIVDNGEGFDAARMKSEVGHFGMTNMQDRAALLDGVVDLQSAPGKGTTVTAQLPIPSRRDDTPGSLERLNSMARTR